MATLKHPSQIRWDSFENRNSTSIAELWPRYSFSPTSPTATRIGSPTSEWASTAWSDEGDHTDDMSMSYNTRRDSRYESQATTRSLRRFVENGIGLDAIHTGHSVVDIQDGEESHHGNERDTSRATERPRPLERFPTLDFGDMRSSQQKMTAQTKHRRSLSDTVRRFLHLSKRGSGERCQEEEDVDEAGCSVGSIIKGIVRHH
jgi:hypothetical protein